MKAQQVLTLFTKLQSAGVENSAGKNKDTKGNFNNIMDLSLKNSSNSETAAQKSTPVVVTKGNPLKKDTVAAKEKGITEEKGGQVKANQEGQSGQVLENKEVDTEMTNQIGIETDEISNISENDTQSVEGDMLGSADDNIIEILPEVLLTDSDVENQVDDSLLQEDVLKACEDFIGKIKDSVKEQLDITEEELEDLLEKIGATIVDLLNPDVQKELILANEGTEDFTVFLTNENLVGKFVQLQEEIHTIVEEAEEVFPELSQKEFISLLQDGMENLTEEESVTALDQEGMYQYEDIEKTAKSVKSEENLITSVVEDEQLQDTEQFSNLNLSNRENLKETSADTLGQEKKEAEISVVSLKEETASKGQDFQQSKDGFPKETPKNPTVEQFIQNLTVSEQEAVKPFDERVVQQMRNIVEQVVEQIKVVVKPDTTSMELQLNPANLGKVNLSVVAKEGTLTASLVVQNEMAKQALESQMQVLRENLNNQGLKVEAVEVSVSDFSFAQSGQTDGGQQQENRKKAPRKINLDMLSSELDQLSEEDALAAKVMVSNGNQVDYTA